MLQNLQSFYETNGISQYGFHCPNYVDCRDDNIHFTEAKATFVSTGYEKHLLPRVLILSLDSGDSNPNPEDRTLAAVRKQEEMVRDVSTLPRNDHWYCTHEIIHSILRKFKPDLRLIEDVQHYFAHINSAKCCQNKSGRSQADDLLFKNCRGFVRDEIPILAPEILVTQGQKARDVIRDWFHVVKEIKGVHNNCGNISEIKIITINDRFTLWIQTYHPKQKSGLYHKQRKELVLAGEYGKIAEKFMNEHHSSSKSQTSLGK